MEGQATGIVINCKNGYCTLGKAERSPDALTDHLKRFRARSKLILTLAGEGLKIWDGEAVFRNMQPFPGKKSLFLKVKCGEEMKWGRGAELIREWEI